MQQDLEEAGFRHYETSAFARSGQFCRHNLNYWQFGDYIGISAGAHGKISHHDRIERTVRKRHPNDYLQAIAVDPVSAAERRTVARADLPFEFMMNALRLTEGVPAAWLAERTGISSAAIAKPLLAAQRQGLLDTDPAYLRATPLGRRFLNDLLQYFLA